LATGATNLPFLTFLISNIVLQLFTNLNLRTS